jgi:hypothetical protein
MGISKKEEIIGYQIPGEITVCINCYDEERNGKISKENEITRDMIESEHKRWICVVCGKAFDEI